MKIGQMTSAQFLKSYGDGRSEALALAGTELVSFWLDFHTRLWKYIEENGLRKHPHYMFLVDFLYHDGNVACGHVRSWIDLQGFKTQQGEEELWQESIWKGILRLHDFVRIAEYIEEKEGI